jgi:hypothetical protein
MIESEFVGIASDLDSIAVRIQKTDGPITGYFQKLGSADDGNFAPLQNWI